MVKKSKKKQKGGSHCYSTECADHALKVMNDKNALVPFNKNTLESPLLTRQMNIKHKGGGSTNVWRKIGLSKPNDLVNNIFDGIKNIKNTWVGDEQGPTSDTLEHPIADNEKNLMDVTGADDITIQAYLNKAKLPTSFNVDAGVVTLGGKKRRKSRKKSKKHKTNKRRIKKQKPSKRKRNKRRIKKQRTKKRRKSRRK